MTEDIERIARHHGAYEQLSVCQEECAELIQAISKLLREKRGEDVETMNASMVRITEEIADVELMLEQVVILTGIRREDVDSVKRYKIARELGRIKHDDNQGCD